MYYLFKYKGWSPTKFYNMPPGEKLITDVFVEKEIEEHNEEIKHQRRG